MSRINLDIPQRAKHGIFDSLKFREGLSEMVQPDREMKSMSALLMEWTGLY